MFLWCRLPEGIDAATLARLCLEQGVVLAPGNAFSQSLSAGATCVSMWRSPAMPVYMPCWRGRWQARRSIQAEPEKNFINELKP